MELMPFSRQKNDRSATRKGDGASHSHESAESQQPLDDPLQRLFWFGRFGLIAADPSRWKDHPKGEAIYKSVLETIDEQFGLVPKGFSSLPQTIHDAPGCPEIDVATNEFVIARHCVTNAEFQRYVNAGGYDDLDLWAQDLWPHLIDFKDLTGQPGPRYWRDGRHDKRLTTHPVVGICYYEAEAYARWVGYRLPTEAEWQMAASWRIRSSAQTIRRYPWGDALDTRHCNVWASGVGDTVPVSEYPSGAAPNGTLQLVGNVWEWTCSDFTAVDDEGRKVVGDMVLKAIRGGAFDTYFPSQATSTFRTGTIGLARFHNIGLRCALDIRSNDSGAPAAPPDTTASATPDSAGAAPTLDLSENQ